MAALLLIHGALACAHVPPPSPAPPRAVRDIFTRPPDSLSSPIEPAVIRASSAAQAATLQDAAAQHWATLVIDSLSIRARIAQLMASPVRGFVRGGERIGGLLVAPDDSPRLARTLSDQRRADGIPVMAIASGDPLAGARLLVGIPQFPTLLGLAAVNDTTAVCAAARAIAGTARDRGVHSALVTAPPAVDPGGETERTPTLTRTLRVLTRCALHEGFAFLHDPHASTDRSVLALTPRIGRIHAPPGEEAGALIAALAAGHDMVIVRNPNGAGIDSAVAAIADGRLSQARIDTALSRVLYLKARLGLALDMPDDAAGRAAARFAAAESLAASLARRSIVLARDRQLLSVHPLDHASLRDVRVIVYRHDEATPASADSRGLAFVQELRRLAGRGRRQVIHQHVITQRSTAAALRSITTSARSADLVILASFFPPFRERDTSGLPTAIETMQQEIIARQRHTMSVVFGEPDSLPHSLLAGTIVVGWSPHSSVTARAAARVVAGSEMPDASLPVDVAGVLRAGDRARTIRYASPDGFANSRRLRRTVTPALRRALRDSVQRILDGAVADGAFPGAFAVVGTRRSLLARYGAGQLDRGEPARPSGTTLWDLASLTKVVGTTSGIARLVGQGRIALDDPVQRYLPNWTGTGKEAISIRHLLTHSSGLPAWSALYRDAASTEEALALVYAMPLDTLPGVRMVYSDLGAILLGEIIARVSGESLDEYLTREIFTPLGMRTTLFRPGEELRARIAPTEIDPWRGRHLRGEVHDENAFRLGGVAGHAGLFSTADDLARFAQMLLSGGALSGRRVIAAEALDVFAETQNAAVSQRALGWDTPTGTNSAGHLVSTRTFGHTGFTGTSIWIDPANDVFVLLLSNRVNPSRENQRIGAVRVALADAVMSVLTVPRESPAQPRQP